MKKLVAYCKIHKCRLIATSLFDLICPKAKEEYSQGESLEICHYEIPESVMVIF